jgi:hypothetical protein
MQKIPKPTPRFDTKPFVREAWSAGFIEGRKAIVKDIVQHLRTIDPNLSKEDLLFGLGYFCGEIIK